MGGGRGSRLCKGAAPAGTRLTAPAAQQVEVRVRTQAEPAQGLRTRQHLETGPRPAAAGQDRAARAARDNAHPPAAEPSRVLGAASAASSRRPRRRGPFGSPQRRLGAEGPGPRGVNALLPPPFVGDPHPRAWAAGALTAIEMKEAAGPTCSPRTLRLRSRPPALNNGPGAASPLPTVTGGAPIGHGLLLLSAHWTAPLSFP